MPKYTLVIFTILFSLLYFTHAQNVDSQTNPQWQYQNWQPPNLQNQNFPNSINTERENVLIILDSSFSMDEDINGQKKIDIAKQVINQVLDQLPHNVWVGLRVYGHKAGFLGFNACKASELKVAIGPNNQNLIKNELYGIKPVGWTPITYSIQQAIDFDLRGLPGKKRIILVSDGMETCNGSPCDYVVELIRNNSDIKIDVIGFDISDQAAKSQLKCTALATKGKYYSANSASELLDSLSQSLKIIKEVEGKIILPNTRK